MAKQKTQKPTSKKASSSTKPEVVVDNTQLELVLPWSEVEQTYNQVLQTTAKQVKLKGFRKGKVPTKLAEEKIGRTQLVQETLEKIVPDAYRKLIEENNKQPLTPPQITPTSMEWEKDWKLTVEIAEKPTVKLGKYQSVIKKALKKADKKIKEDAQEEKLDKKNPAHQHDHDAETHEREVTLHQVFSDLVDAIKPQIPELLLKEETKRELNSLANELERIGLSLDDYLTRRNQSFEDLSAQTAAQKLGQLQLEFILQALQEKEGVEVTEQDVEQELVKMENEQVREQVKQNPQYRQYLEQEIARKKLLDQLLSIK